MYEDYIDGVTVNDYVSADILVETAEELTTSSIVSQVQARHDAPSHQDVHDDSNDEDDEDGEIVPIPSMYCVWRSFVYFLSVKKDNIEKVEAFIDNQRRSWMRQSLLTDFIMS